jgi:2-oxoglutarate ferredoxin oxidoreductase subunit delta
MQMAKIKIDRRRCKGCLLCIAFCPKGSISTDKDLNSRGVKPARFIDKGMCVGCALCAVICPDCCIEVYK